MKALNSFVRVARKEKFQKNMPSIKKMEQQRNYAMVVMAGCYLCKMNSNSVISKTINFIAGLTFPYL